MIIEKKTALKFENHTQKYETVLKKLLIQTQTLLESASDKDALYYILFTHVHYNPLQALGPPGTDVLVPSGQLRLVREDKGLW